MKDPFVLLFLTTHCFSISSSFQHPSSVSRILSSSSLSLSSSWHSDNQIPSDNHKILGNRALTFAAITTTTSQLMSKSSLEFKKDSEISNFSGKNKHVDNNISIEDDINDDDDDINDDGNIENDDPLQNEKNNETSLWTSTSLGSFLLKKRKIEEEEITKIKDLASDRDDDDDDNDDESDNVQRDFDQKIKSLANEAEETLVSFIDLNKGGSKPEKKKNIVDEEQNEKILAEGLDPEAVREVDESVTILSTSRQKLMKDIDELPFQVSPQQQADQQQEQQQQQVQPLDSIINGDNISSLPLSDTAHTARIGRDMRHLAVSIASTIENAEQWKTFTEDGGGVLPLIECIHDGAREIEKGPWEKNVYDEEMNGLIEKREEVFAAACSACKTLRDLCAISKPFAAIVTDSILRANVASYTKAEQKDERVMSQDGLISDMITLLRFSQQAANMYNSKSRRQKMRDFRNRGVQRLGNRKQKRDARNKCGLYVTQLLLEMAFASDNAITTFKGTKGLTDAILSCSSYAQSERLRRRWIRYPIEVVKKHILKKDKEIEHSESPFLAAASIHKGIPGQTQGAANQLLAALGHNIWYPKTAGQKGLRILCLDGGGTRGITAISSMRSIVNAIGGVEVCDAFDMIVGTSTGAIIAFLVGLRRESSALARKRYDRLIKKIFVKSALSAPMLLFTTASYDEAPFNSVVGEILQDNSMLSSRSDPRVPLVFAISSKMSSTPTQICLFRNYNYGSGSMRDSFVLDPIEAKRDLGLELEDDIYKLSGIKCYESDQDIVSKGVGGSRHSGSFRVLQRAALRATTAAPTVFKPVLMGGELYCDGGIVASNPTAVAIHEARTVYPDIPIELVVSCGTGRFVEEKSAPRIGWDGIIGQIVNSATDGEQVHHILEDIFGGQEGATRLGMSPISNKTKYYRFQPCVGTSDRFPIDGTDPIKLEELSQLTTDYMNEPEQRQKLNEIVDILKGQTGIKRRLLSKLGK